MEDINELLELREKEDTGQTFPLESKSISSLIGKVIRDTIVFFIIFLACNLVLFEMEGFRNTREKIAIFLLLLSTIAFTYLTNKSYKTSFLYGFIVFIMLLYVLDRRRFLPSDVAILVGILTVSSCFYHFKRSRPTLNIEKLNLSDFTEIGILERSINPDKYREGVAISLDRMAYNKSKPVLLKKIINENGDLFLNYSNKSDLDFILLLTQDKKVYIQHFKRNKLFELTNRSVLECLKTIAL